MHVRLLALLAFGLLLGGCVTTGDGRTSGIDDLNRELDDLRARRAQNDPAAEAQFARLTEKAQSAARSEPQPQSKVAKYRVAAIAAWQAGPAQGAKPLEIRREGEQACAALPPNQARPTDCAIIALAAALAVADDVQTRLEALKEKREVATAAHRTQCEALTGNERQTCLNTRAKLPRSDGEIIENDVFRGLRDQYDAVTAVRGQLGSVDASLQSYADSERIIIYCGAMTSLSLLQDCEGSSASVAELNDDLATMQCRLSKPEHECETPDLAALPAVNCNLQPPDDGAVFAAKDS